MNSLRMLNIENLKVKIRMSLAKVRNRVFWKDIECQRLRNQWVSGTNRILIPILEQLLTPMMSIYLESEQVVKASEEANMAEMHSKWTKNISDIL
jgi:hypothetical protein